MSSTKNKALKVLQWLDLNAEITINIFLMSFMVIILFIQVIMRRVFNNSLFWSEELARYMFIWLVYLGISHGARLRKHIKIDASLKLLPVKARPYMEILGDVLFLSFAVFVVFTAYRWVSLQLMLGQRSAALGIPMWVIFSAPMVGFTLTAVRQIQSVFFRIREIMKAGKSNG